MVAIGVFPSGKGHPHPARVEEDGRRPVAVFATAFSKCQVEGVCPEEVVSGCLKVAANKLGISLDP